MLVWGSIGLKTVAGVLDKGEGDDYGARDEDEYYRQPRDYDEVRWQATWRYSW